MAESVLLGRGRQILELPWETWAQHLAQVPQHSGDRHRFMTEEHHRVRYFVVRELPLKGAPVAPQEISEALHLPLARVEAILDELERKLFFLVRNEQGAVSWAYPVTVEPTPHHLSFSSGERLYAAWAEDAIATPFVQGRLRQDHLTVTIETVCAHSSRPMRITWDSDMKVSVDDEGAEPLVFMPQVDWATFSAPNIIDAYWRNSVFFWSEEQARQYRASVDQVDGTYLTLEQCAYAIPITQGALFAFE